MCIPTVASPAFVAAPIAGGATSSNNCAQVPALPALVTISEVPTSPMPRTTSLPPTSTSNLLYVIPFLFRHHFSHLTCPIGLSAAEID